MGRDTWNWEENRDIESVGEGGEVGCGGGLGDGKTRDRPAGSPTILNKPPDP